METSAIGYVPWGLDADWPDRRWVELVHGRRGEPARGLRLGHASDSAMVLICTYPRHQFDSEMHTGNCDPIREIAYETTYAQINLALHQISSAGDRPDGLIGSLVRYAGQQADRYREWTAAHWGTELAHITQLASWQSGFSLAYPDAYVMVHACGMAITRLRLAPVPDLSAYSNAADPMELGAMHWELWASRPELDYNDLARTMVAP